jgi:cell wall-associated NlpC family hydrolase
VSGHYRPIALLLLACMARPADGQGLGFGAAAVLDAPEAGLWTLGYSPRGLGPFDVTLNGLYYSGAGRGRWGGGVDLSLFRRAGVRWHVMGGVQAGFGTGEAEETWTAWSAGVGFRLLRAGKVDLALEGRYLRLSAPDDALLLGLRLGIGLRGRRPGPAAGSSGTAAGAVPLATVVPAARSAAAQAVIETALSAMGTPYAWGGTDANGFDCSGLIQYAYRAHGIPLPRRSVEQAREGAAVPRDLDALLPGDILTFANGTNPVSHVGLYLGEGRFIHSASAGVQVSTLGPDDPAGGYWWRRWVGARRILPDSPEF